MSFSTVQLQAGPKYGGIHTQEQLQTPLSGPVVSKQASKQATTTAAAAN